MTPENPQPQPNEPPPASPDDVTLRLGASPLERTQRVEWMPPANPGLRVTHSRDRTDSRILGVIFGQIAVIALLVAILLQWTPLRKTLAWTPAPIRHAPALEAAQTTSANDATNQEGASYRPWRDLRSQSAATVALPVASPPPLVRSLYIAPAVPLPPEPTAKQFYP